MIQDSSGSFQVPCIDNIQYNNRLALKGVNNVIKEILKFLALACSKSSSNEYNKDN